MNHRTLPILSFVALFSFAGCGATGSSPSAPAKGAPDAPAPAPAPAPAEDATAAAAPADVAGAAEVKKTSGRVSGDISTASGTIRFEDKLTECVVDGSNAKASGEAFTLEYKDWVGTLKVTYDGGTLDGVIDAKASVSAVGSMITTQGSADGVGWNLKITCD